MSNNGELTIESRETRVASDRRTWRHLWRVLSCIRIDEVLVLQGAPLLGAVFAAGDTTLAHVPALLMFAAASALLVAHVFVFNDWSGMHADLRDPERAPDVFARRGVGRADVQNLWIVLLAGSLLLFLRFPPRTFIIAVMIAGLSALYSAPGTHLKGRPLFSSALHLGGGFLHFLLGYSALRPIDGRAVAVACVLALIFSAGHLTHEVRDADSDRRNRVRTNAVTFGKAPSFLAGFVMFTIADIVLVALAALRIVPRSVVLIAAQYPVHVYWSWQAIRDGLTFQSVRRLQNRYRVVYAVIGALWSIGALLGR
jgi:4-hydroxybenzoate polyprenyltransferase